MNRLDAMKVLVNAYWYLYDRVPSFSFTKDDADACLLIEDKYHYLRRSTSLTDLKPVKCEEGFNGKMPSYF